MEQNSNKNATKQFIEQENHEYKVPTDIISIPSNGIFYEGGEDIVEVAYMTAKDENILTSPNLIQTGKFLDRLLEEKIKSGWVKKIGVNNLLSGDKDAILNFLRITAYGPEYKVMLNDPQTNEEFEYEIDLNKLDYKQVPYDEVEFDKGSNTFSYKIKDMKGSEHDVKFKLLTSYEEEIIVKKSESYAKSQGYNSVNTVVTDKLVAQTVSLDGNTDKIKIKNFIEYQLNLREARKYRDYINKCTPGLDYSYEVIAPSGYRFRPPIQINLAEYFYPSFS